MFSSIRRDLTLRIFNFAARYSSLFFSGNSKRALQNLKSKSAGSIFKVVQLRQTLKGFLDALYPYLFSTVIFFIHQCNTCINFGSKIAVGV